MGIDAQDDAHSRQKVGRSKFNSRQRGDFIEKKKLVAKLREQREAKESKEDGEDTNFDHEWEELDLEEIGDMDPEKQWAMLSKLDDFAQAIPHPAEIQEQLSKLGESFKVAESLPPPPAIPPPGHGDSISAGGSLGSAQLIKYARKLIVPRGLLDEVEIQKLLAVHAAKMRTMPQYAQDMELLAQSCANSEKADLEELRKLTADSKAKGMAEQARKNLDATSKVGTRLSMPPVQESDFEMPDESMMSKSIEQIAKEALELAKRSAAASNTAIQIAERTSGSLPVEALMFLPRGMDPKFFSESLLWWRGRDWLSRDSGITNLMAKSTPAKLVLDSEASYRSAVACLNWCSGGGIRCVLDLPSDFSQQKAQFRDCLREFQAYCHGCHNPETEQKVQLVLDRPHRRARIVRDESEQEDKGDWWALAEWPPEDPAATEPRGIIQCQYHHARQWQRYKVSKPFMRRANLTRTELEEKIRSSVATYYVWDVDFFEEVSLVREKHSEREAADEADEKPTPTTKIAPRLRQDRVEEGADDAWAEGWKRHKVESEKGASWGKDGKSGKDGGGWKGSNSWGKGTGKDGGKSSWGKSGKDGGKSSWGKSGKDGGKSSWSKGGYKGAGKKGPKNWW